MVITRMKSAQAVSEKSTRPGMGPERDGKPAIKVIGIGRAGSDAVSRVYREARSGVEYYCLNTDQHHLERCPVPNKILLGPELIRGVGSDGYPEIGRQAAEETQRELRQIVKGADLVVIVAGLGGGTGTGAAPVVAAMAKESGAHVAAIVTEPFSFEAVDRHESARKSLGLLREIVDTPLVISHVELMEEGKRTKEKYSWDDVLERANSKLDQGIQTLAEISILPRKN